MQMFMNPCKLYDFMWGTTMRRGTRTTILAPSRGKWVFGALNWTNENY